MERTRRGGLVMDIRTRMKWCLRCLWVRNRVVESWFRMAVGVIVIVQYPYHGMDTTVWILMVWCNMTSAGLFPSGDLGFSG